MFKIESYVTPILLSYVDKYVRDFKPIDAQVSLWGGGVALHNLVLKADVLQQEVALPFTLVSGRIHELLIQVPWTKIMSEPIIVTIDTIECVLSLNPPAPGDESAPAEPPSRRTQVVEAPPGYMQALVRRIVSNIALRVHHLIVKYVQDDIVLSLNVKHLAVDSAGADWQPAFADIDQNEPVIRRLVRLDDLTLCLDRADSDGKIRFYQEPLLYRCQLDLRVLTRLVSANTRRAASLSVHLRSTKLAWGVTSDQLVLLLRLLRERPSVEAKPPPPTPKTSLTQTQPLHVTSSNSAEPARQESWSDWAWSWLPTWLDREGAVEEAPVPAVPIPVHFAAYLDDVSLVFKMMEVEGGNRKRARGVLELCAHHAAVKCAMRSPTLLRLHCGLRTLTLLSRGRCACGHLGLEASREEPTIYLRKTDVDNSEEDWTWPEEDLTDTKVELAQAADEALHVNATFIPAQSQLKSVIEQSQPDAEGGASEEPPPSQAPETDELWLNMAPVLYVEYLHERSPPHAYTNPYENPPMDFQYSDWSEVCNATVRLQPVELRVCMGLAHRLAALGAALGDTPPPADPDLPMRVLTVEECDALMDNLPQRRANIEALGLRVRLLPWDHAPSERPAEPPLALELIVPRAVLACTGPLYPHRVCSAACQMPKDAGPLWNGARLHVSGTFATLQAQICAGDAPPRPCARADLRFVVNLLLNRRLFTRRESVVLSYTVKIREANICGSAARLQAAWHVPASLLAGRVSLPLRHTSLARDALADEESVAIDMTLEDFSLRGYLTKHINTHILSLQSARATALHAPKGGELKQAWLFSAPDTPTTTPYLRCAVQWCWTPLPNSLDYVGMWTEPVSYSADPLLIAWLAYKPVVRPNCETVTMASAANLPKSLSTTQYFLRRRTPPSSGGRATRLSGAELVHQRPRSLGSSSEPSERREDRPKQPLTPAKSSPSWGSGEWLVAAHARLRRTLVHVELGLVLLYVSGASASALDCATVRDAMERHAADRQPVLALSLGRVSMHSNATKKHLWQEIRHDGPTFITPNTENPDDDSFPWKMRLADVSCYTLEVRARSERSSRERSAGALRSQLKVSAAASPKTVLEMLTTTVTLSVVTKSLQHKTAPKRDHMKHTETSTEEDRMKYFTAGVDFKPSTLKEFFRGPAKRKATPEPEAPPPEEAPPTPATSSGPVVSLGVHMHADTPPIIVRLDHEQVHLVASALHGVQHIVTLLQRAPVLSRGSYTSVGGSHRSLIRSVSELEEVRSNSEDTPSENRSELISIFEARSVTEEPKMKTFFWFQWVVSRATLVVATHNVKLAFDADDIISTVDLQQHYNQFKIKVASASVRHYERTGSDEWTAGVLGGRVLEAREPTNAQEENHFMSVTITQAQISNLPPNWKEELHPKLLEQRNGVDSMWEIYATLAPLEVVVQPTILENVVSVLNEFAPRSFCSLRAELAQRPTNWQWPFCYVNAGGLRLLITSEDEEKDSDDTFMIVIGKVTVNPHPENPICRRAVNTGADWMSGSGPFEGRQYEMIVKNFAIRSAQFSQLVYQEASEKGSMQSTGGENPALKWTQPIVSPVITPILHAVDIGCVVAPAMYVTGALACGPALELNLVSDCALELSVQQLGLVQRVARDVLVALVHHRPPGLAFEEHDTCPYASLLKDFQTLDDLSIISDCLSMDAETLKPSPSETAPAEGGGGSEAGGGGGSVGGGGGGSRGAGTDSGVDTVTSHSMRSGSRNRDDAPPSVVKKSVSIAFVDQMTDSSEFLEVFVTMGTIEVSLYTADDSSPEVIALRPPPVAAPAAPPEPPLQVNVVFEEADPNKDDMTSSVGSKTKSLSDVGGRDLGKSTLHFKHTMFTPARRTEGSVPLVHCTLHQPNLYYWRRKAQKSLQVSLFNAWVGLGGGQAEGQWSAPLLSTSRGAPDPVTDIPPALVTVKATAPIGSSSTKGSIKIDVERPVQVEVCTDRLRRLKGILALISDRISRTDDVDTPVVQLPILYRLRRFLIYQAMESITVQTSQLSVCGSEGAVGCDSASLQLAAGARPERITARALLCALLLAAGPPADTRHVLLQPLTLGGELEAAWETWRRIEGGVSACEPSMRMTLDLDRVTLDLRPSELAAASRIRDALYQLSGHKDRVPRTPANSSASDTLHRSRASGVSPSTLNLQQFGGGGGGGAEAEPADHYYKDDLRSGAFKIVSGGQLPMAYQVTLHGPGVAWRYPHPRAITRIVAFPLPEQDEEVQCILELYSPMLMRWHPHTYFKIPVGEPRELQLCISTPETVFAHMWRFRACVPNENADVPFEFDTARYVPRSDPLLYDCQPEMEYPRGRVPVSAEQLSGVVRVDSYLAPRALPRLRLAVRLAALQLHAHNALPFLSSQVTALEGYYVSRPLMRSHRVLTLSARDAALHAHLGAPDGCKALLDARVGGDILDCATGTMEQLVEEFRIEGAVSLASGEGRHARVRTYATPVHVALHVPRLRTVHALVADWRAAFDQYMDESASQSSMESPQKPLRKRELAAVTAAALDGRVSLWLHNSCAAALRVGQEGTDEIVPLGPGARLAYRWRSPTAPKKLRIALAGPATDWHWSTSTGFVAGTYRVRLEDAEALGSKASPGGGVYAHLRVEEAGARRSMHISGRLALANMLRYNVLYKVRARCPEAQWRTVCSGELESETVGRSVMCGAECEMTLKIKFAAHNTGWSGDIPLKECPKENVPWLVKVPSDGDVPYMSVWCRVVRARSDGRVLATIWPLYVLHSHLPLDTDVLIVTETAATFLDDADDPNAAPLVQSAPGRGASTHLVAPGTTSARHSLSLQYRNIECPVTREAIPLHYGVTDTSVFDKRTPVATVEEVIEDVLSWLDRSGRDAASPWPYSMVAKHWPGKWQPALLQPRCDITVRYQAVRAGGGCCLELQLCPLVLLCNAAPLALTLRAHDAAPLCKLEAGAAIAPPAQLLKKPFFISVEVGRETFVSGQLEVSDEPAGRYAAPPPGRVTLDRASPFVVHCNQKVALLTMYYEIKQDINVLGVSTTFVLINRLHADILVSAIAVPIDAGAAMDLRPKTFKVVEPTKEGSIHGMPLCRFWLAGRWRGGCPAELGAFLCVALPAGGYPACAPVPVRLGEPPLRRALALSDAEGRPVPVVVTQLKHEGRWLVMVASDPCPQFLVHNRTRAPLLLAQPVRATHEPCTSRTEAVAECPGAKWRCLVAAGALTHYSSPQHCARYPPQAPPAPDGIQMLTLARVKEDGEPEWCAPVAAADGEQLLQLTGGVTVKLRVRTQPHSTLLELQDVEQHDISASDIRNRLLEPHISKDTVVITKKDLQRSHSRKLQRTGGDEKLLDSSLAPEELGEATLDPFEGDADTVVLAEPEPSEEQLSTHTPMPGGVTGERRAPETDLQECALQCPPSSLQVIKDTVRLVEPNKDEEDDDVDAHSTKFHTGDPCPSEVAFLYPEITRAAWEEHEVGSTAPWTRFEWARCVFAALSVELSASAEARPLVALHVSRAALLVLAEPKRTKTTISIAGLQIDNLQYESGQFDFGVVASTPTEAGEEDPWPPLWSMLVDAQAFSTRHETARVLLRAQHDTWAAAERDYTELTELELSVGPLALYVEDAYVSALVELARLAWPPTGGRDAAPALAELRALQAPLRLQALHVRPLDLTLTLHTAVRMYIALDQSPLHLGAFRLQRMMTSVEQLTHALTVHYLSAAILGAGWVVGGLELLGAPGALAARVGGASGGVRGVASAAAAALVRSLSAWAGSLARNLDLLAGDEEHARRAAAARRRPPPSLVAGLVAGITNFAINILGAVGGLAHHPLVGVAVGETASGATALRRGLLGALTKPLSATADLVAYAGHGLLTQTGWDPVPQPRPSRWGGAEGGTVGWRRDCVRWAFRLAELTALAGFEVLLDNAPLQLLLTHKFLVVADLDTEKIVEMIDFKFCSVEPYKGPIIQLCVKQRRLSKMSEARGVDEDDEYQLSAAAMARVARYTGAAGAADGVAEARVLSLLPPPGRSHALHAALAAAVRHNSDAHFPLL